MQHSLYVYITYKKYEWKQRESFPEAFCQTPSTEAANVSWQLEQPFTALKTEPSYPHVQYQAEPILQPWIRSDLIIPLQFMGIQFNTLWNSKTSIFPESSEMLSQWNTDSFSTGHHLPAE